MNTGVRPLAFFAIAADIGAMRRGNMTVRLCEWRRMGWEYERTAVRERKNRIMRFIHIADVHLGATPDKGFPWSYDRGREIWESFQKRYAK